MAQPLLLSPDRLANITASHFWTQGLLETGRVASAACTGRLPSLNPATHALPTPLRADWQRLLSLEWLLAAMTNPKRAPRVLSAFADVPLSGTGSATARQLAQRGAAVAMIPLAGAAGRAPAVAALILSPLRATRPPSDQRAAWQGAATWLQQHRLTLYALRMPASSHQVQGPSWMLGATLAAHCLAPEHRTHVLALARDWLPTGEVTSDGRLRRVALGNKPDLPVSGRRWLLPAGTATVPSMAENHVQATTFEVAWKHLCLAGTITELSKQPWPQDLGTLHSFVSGATHPVLAVTLLARPQRLVLWHSQNVVVSRQPAHEIRQVLRRLRPQIKVVTRTIPSHSMADAETTLQSGLTQELRQGHLVLFNVTQGNRLMAFAAHTLARQHPNLWLLYRDNDAAGLDFSAMRYDARDYPVSFTLTAMRTDVPDVDWSNLLKPFVPRPGLSAQELLAQIAPHTAIRSLSSKKKSCETGKI